MTEQMTEQTSDLREARLPRWAQQELEILRRKLAETRTALEGARLASNPQDTDTLTGDEWNGGPFGLPPGTVVTFRLPDGEIRARVEGDHLDVMTTGRGIGDLVIRPRVTNAVHLSVGR